MECLKNDDLKVNFLWRWQEPVYELYSIKHFVKDLAQEVKAVSYNAPEQGHKNPVSDICVHT